VAFEYGCPMAEEDALPTPEPKEIDEQKALELLQNSDLSISAIGEAVGYRYQTSFTAAVKHFFGVTPKQLRDSGRQG